MLLATVYVLAKIYRGGNWLTFGAVIFIGLAQICNIVLTIIILEEGIDDKLWAAIIASFFTAGLLGLNEYVMWGYAYHYWVTS